MVECLTYKINFSPQTSEASGSSTKSTLVHKQQLATKVLTDFGMSISVIRSKLLNQLDIAKRAGRVGFRLGQLGCRLGWVDLYISHESSSSSSSSSFLF